MQDVGGQQGAEPPGKRSGCVSSATKFEGSSLTIPGGPNGPPSTVREVTTFGDDQLDLVILMGVTDVMILQDLRRVVLVGGVIRLLVGG